MQDFQTVVESKVVKVPMGTSTNKAGEEKPSRFGRTGIKISFGDGTWWFYHFRAKSWTRHRLGLPLWYKSGQPILGEDGLQVMGPERKDRFASESELLDQLGHCKWLIDALLKGVNDALQDETERAVA